MNTYTMPQQRAIPIRELGALIKYHSRGFKIYEGDRSEYHAIMRGSERTWKDEHALRVRFVKGGKIFSRFECDLTWKLGNRGYRRISGFWETGPTCQVDEGGGYVRYGISTSV
jgi:hypothetical protein